MTRRSVIRDGHVADLPGHPFEAFEDLAIDDDPPADARADRDIDEMRDPFGRTEITLPEGRGISVVDQESFFLSFSWMMSRKGTSSQPGRLGEVKRMPASVSTRPGAPTPIAETRSIAKDAPSRARSADARMADHSFRALRRGGNAMVAGKHFPPRVDDGSQDLRPSEIDPQEEWIIRSHGQFSPPGDVVANVA